MAVHRPEQDWPIESAGFGLRVCQFDVPADVLPFEFRVGRFDKVDPFTEVGIRQFGMRPDLPVEACR